MAVTPLKTRLAMVAQDEDGVSEDGVDESEDGVTAPELSNEPFHGGYAAQGTSWLRRSRRVFRVSSRRSSLRRRRLPMRTASLSMRLPVTSLRGHLVAAPCASRGFRPPCAPPHAHRAAPPRSSRWSERRLADGARTSVLKRQCIGVNYPTPSRYACVRYLVYMCTCVLYQVHEVKYTSTV
jgi:hypothetical protein